MWIIKREEKNKIVEKDARCSYIYPESVPKYPGRTKKEQDNSNPPAKPGVTVNLMPL